MKYPINHSSNNSYLAAIKLSARRLTLGLGVGLMLCSMMGCREHPRVTSRESLDFIKQVYTACNTRNQERLTVCRQKLDELAASGELSEAEQESFRSIISSAESGDWASAQRSSLQFARDQMR